MVRNGHIAKGEERINGVVTDKTVTHVTPYYMLVNRFFKNHPKAWACLPWPPRDLSGN